MKEPAAVPATRSGNGGTGPRTGRSRVRAFAGLALLAVGIICSIPGVPGPGIATIVVALLILSEHYSWAMRALEWIRKKARQTGLPEWPWLHHGARSSRDAGVSGIRSGGDTKTSAEN